MDQSCHESERPASAFCTCEINWIRNRSAEDSCPTDQDRRTVRRKIGRALTANGPEPCLLPWFRQCRPPASRSRPAGVHSCLQRQREIGRAHVCTQVTHAHLVSRL